MSPYSPKKSKGLAPDEASAVLRVCLLHRNIREYIGSALKLQLQIQSSLSHETEFLGTPKIVEEQDKSLSEAGALLVETADLAGVLIDQMDKVYQTYQKSPHPQVVPPETGLGLTLLVKAAASQDFRGISAKASHRNQVDLTDVLDEVDATANASSQAQLGPDLPFGSNDITRPPTTSEDYEAWRSLVKKQARTVLDNRMLEFCSLTTAILEVINQPAKSGRTASKDQQCYSPYCSEATQEKSKAAGYVKSEVFDKFNEDLYFDNLWSIGRLIALNTDVIDARIAKKMSEDTAMILALATLCDHMDTLAPIFSGLTDYWNKQLPTDSTTPGNTASLIATIGEFVAGSYICLGVGGSTQRKNSSSSYQENVGRWLKALLFPELAVDRTGSAWRLPCIECGDRKLRHPTELQNSSGSGLGGPMRQVTLKDRLSISNYSIRRGSKVGFMAQVGRIAYYPCLVILLCFAFDPSIMIIILYFSTLIHFSDKNRRGKHSIILFADKYRLVASLPEEEEVDDDEEEDET
ncbi:hypothetical protein L486_02037 [Kwoniella mangroviensis CBS 10435]|uniref:Uncharacterized protein n=1 Tax=Kwoniella mangroviensis CBS 10435 TaxID=1331196 RepID=A0A1B9J3N2_9TREE|nr:hypothetical protein L486_02037 [Kwoniella mangroviensis CBS 10435]